MPSTARSCSAGALCILLLLVLPSTAAAQRWIDLVVTAGVSGEDYEGNLPAFPVVEGDTEDARAAVGELGVAGSALLLERPSSWIVGTFDLGLRQFAATGFQTRDHAPREWAGTAGLLYRQRAGSAGMFELRGSLHGRAVDDRPPMPLFLQPGYERLTGSLRYVVPTVEGVRFDITAGVERSDFEAPRRVTDSDLLDREAWSVEVGAGWGAGLDLRFYAGLRATDYPEQTSFDEEDPFRRDRTITVGAEWNWAGTVQGTVGVEGVVNRSNSRRPEYDAFVFRSRFSAPLPVYDLTASLFTVITGKTYVFSTPFARLVPGEEADNASVVYLEVAKPLAPNLDAALRAGWTRAETEIGESYYERRGLSFLLRYRPLSRF